MLVAKLPGSTYATAATNAGPRNGEERREPRRSPAQRLLCRLEDARLAGKHVVQRVDEGVAVAQSRWGHVMQLDMAKLYIRK